MAATMGTKLHSFYLYFFFNQDRCNFVPFLGVACKKGRQGFDHIVAVVILTFLTLSPANHEKRKFPMETLPHVM